MRIAIVGGGFAGLAAGWELVKNGHQVVIFEGGETVGGLAVAFGKKSWKWRLEKYYHHIFTNDVAVMKLAREVGVRVGLYLPKTMSWIGDKQWQLDSPLSVLRFAPLGWWARIRMGAGLAALKLIGNGRFLEKYAVVETLPRVVGWEGYKTVWEPLLRAKFGKFISEVNLAWFWARVNKRTQRLGYFDGGFQKLAEMVANRIETRGGVIKTGVTVANIKELDGFDEVLVTTPAPIADKILGSGVVKWPKINYLWGQTLVLELNRSLMNGYWINILEKDWPFLVVVEHTRLIDKKNYGGKTIVYLGNYLEGDDPRVMMDADTLIKRYLPYLRKINMHFRKNWITDKWLWKTAYAQPVFPINYSWMLPPLKTSIANVWVANMSQVYPWDRGVNYAVEMGYRVAKEMMKDDV